MAPPPCAIPKRVQYDSAMGFMSRRRSLWVGLVLGSLSSTALAQQQPAPGVVTVGELSPDAASVDATGPFGVVRVQGGRVVLNATGEAPRVFDPGCTARAAVGVRQLYVACDGGAIRTFEPGAGGAPTLASERRVGAEVRGLFVQGGRVWVEYARVEAQPVENLPEAGGGGGVMLAMHARGGVDLMGAAGPASERVRGTVLESHGTTVVISLGRAQGLRGDERVEIGARSGGETGEIPASVVGRVREVAASRAMVEIGFGEAVSAGDGVRVTARATTASMVAPPRSGNLLAFGGSIRAMIPIGSLGIGAFGDLWASWHASFPFAVRARLFPLGATYIASSSFGSGSEAGGLFGAAIEAMFDSQYFAVGLGLGASQYRSYTAQFGFGITQVLRVGALDGFHLYAQNHLLVASGRFEYGGTDATIQIPLSRSWWLTIRGGGSVAPYGFTEVGMRIATQGNGRSGSLFVTPTIGWAGMNTGGYAFRAGPTVGIGIEYRYGL